MSYYINTNTEEIRQLQDSLIESWTLSNNPKLLEWHSIPDKPTQNSVWYNGQWIEPQPAIPSNISARQIRLWLIQHEIQLDQVDIAIQQIQDDMARQTVKIEWEYAPYVERHHPWLVPLAQSLGLSEEQIDQAFREASLL